MSDSPVLTRNLTFKTKDLGADATLMLTFDKNIKGPHSDTFPVCWKVTRFGKEGPYSMHTTFRSEFAFVKPQAEGDTISASTYKFINVGEKTILTKDDRDVYHFSDVVKGEDGYLEALNSCPKPEDMAIGFTDPTSGPEPTPALYFTEVDTGAILKAQFTPVLRAYITEQYQQAEIIKTEVSTPFIWEQDLARLSQRTSWVLTREGPTTYKLTQE